MLGISSGVAVASASSLATLGRGLACGAVVLVASCGTEPSCRDICTIGATIFGVVSREGVPAAGVAVRTSLFREQCQQPISSGTPVATDAMGRYRKVLLFVLTASGTPFCVEVRAVFDRGGVPDSVTIGGIPITMSDFVDQPRDSFRVDIALPP